MCVECVSFGGLVLGYAAHIYRIHILNLWYKLVALRGRMA